MGEVAGCHVAPLRFEGADDHDRSGSPGPAHAAPPVLLGHQVIGVGLEEQLYEHRVHDVPPQADGCILGYVERVAESRHRAVRDGRLDRG
jgi:hypothetical protein